MRGGAEAVGPFRQRPGGEVRKGPRRDGGERRPDRPGKAVVQELRRLPRVTHRHDDTHGGMDACAKLHSHDPNPPRANATTSEGHVVRTVDGGEEAFRLRRRKYGFQRTAMDWLDVLRRIEAGEDARTEFRREIGHMSAVGRTLCALANGDGGVVLLGVDDSGGITGIAEDPGAVQERLTSFLHNGCGRPIAAECGHHRAGGRWVHWVEVRRRQRGFDPFSFGGRFWVRRGRSTAAPSASALPALFNAFGLVFTEQQIVPSATVRDIDLHSFGAFMAAQGKRAGEEPRPDIGHDLRNASVCDLLDGVLRPTLYGLMVFGRNPQGHRHTTSLFVRCAAYGGSHRATDVLSVGEARGRLDEQVTRAMDWFRSLGRRESYGGLLRTDVFPVPESVLREALVNAVIHRDYALTGSQVLLEVFDDRIEVTSPGTLPNHMTAGQARAGGAPRSRNEMMANAMVVRRLMERRGRGWLLMRYEMTAFNGTEPELINDRGGRFVRVTFRLEPD